MTLSHKGRYWQVSGLEKQVGLRAIIYIRGPLGSARKGDFAHCSVVQGARKRAPLFPTRPRRPFLLSHTAGGGGRHPQLSSLAYGEAGGSAITRRNRAPGPGDGPRAACSMQR
jgi:hypothetical protein